MDPFLGSLPAPKAMQSILFHGNLDADNDSVTQEPSFEKEQGEEGADSQLHCTSRVAYPCQNVLWEVLSPTILMQRCLLCLAALACYCM